MPNLCLLFLPFGVYFLKQCQTYLNRLDFDLLVFACSVQVNIDYCRVHVPVNAGFQMPEREREELMGETL